MQGIEMSLNFWQRKKFSSWTNLPKKPVIKISWDISGEWVDELVFSWSFFSTEVITGLLFVWVGIDNFFDLEVSA